MKKLIQATFFLLLIGGFLFLTQISCQKSVAQTNGSQTVTQANLILLGKGVQIVISPAIPPVTNDTGAIIKPGVAAVTASYSQYYVASLNGSNLRQIPITLPAGLYAAGGPGYLTANGQTLVFTVTNQTTNQPGTVHALYSCSVDGSNLRKVMDTDSQLLGAY